MAALRTIMVGRNRWLAFGSGALLALTELNCSGKVIQGGNAQGGSAGTPSSSVTIGRAGSSPASAGDSGQVSAAPGGSGPVNAGGSGNPASAGLGGSAGGGEPSAGGTFPIFAGGGNATGGDANDNEIPLIPSNGWVDGKSNVLGIQGAIFGYGDQTSEMGMALNFTGAHACVKGTAAKVDMTSPACVDKMFTPPATDCYGEFWGAAIGLNLNQTIDSTTMMGGTPQPFDASALKGFAFDVSGNTVPGPKDLRFRVETDSMEFCNPAPNKVIVGTNTLLLSDLRSQCFTTLDPPAPSAETVKTKLLRISWQVVTNSSAPVPFDFCISNIRALLK